MTEVVTLLRKIGDERAHRAEAARADGPVVTAEAIDLAARWHWLAREAAKLCKKGKELDGDRAACVRCPERCRD